MKQLYLLFLICFTGFSSLASQIQLDTVITGLSSPTRIINDGETLYFGTGNQINTYDLSATDPVVEVLHTAVGTDVADIVLLGTDLYYANFFAGQIERLDLTVSPPTVTTLVSGLSTPNGLIEKDSILYFTSSGINSLFRYDLTAAAPEAELLTSETLRFPGPMEINGDELYISCLLGDSLALVDLSADPIVSESLVSPIARPLGQLLIGDQLYVASLNGNSVLIFNTADFSAAPDTIGGFNRPADIVAVGNKLYITDFAAGQILSAELLLAGEQCGNAIPVDELFGQAPNVPQNSSIYNNTGYNNEGDPDFGFDCFAEPSFGVTPTLNHTIFYSFIGDGNTYQIAAPSCNVANPIFNNDTQIALYSGECGNLTAVSCAEDISGSDLIASLTVETEVGLQYYFFVDGFFDPDFDIGSAQGEFCLEVTNLTVSSVNSPEDISASIFPNPTSGQLQLPNFEVTQVTVYNLLGSKVANFNYPGNTIDVGHLPTGTYLLQITDSSNKLYSARIVKK